MKSFTKPYISCCKQLDPIEVDRHPAPQSPRQHTIGPRPSTLIKLNFYSTDQDNDIDGGRGIRVDQSHTLLNSNSFASARILVNGGCSAPIGQVVTWHRVNINLPGALYAINVCRTKGAPGTWAHCLIMPMSSMAEKCALLALKSKPVRV